MTDYFKALKETLCIEIDLDVAFNLVRVSNTRSGAEVEQIADISFSNGLDLIDDYDALGILLRNMLPMVKKTRGITLFATARIAIEHRFDNQTNRRELRKLALELGFSKIYFAKSRSVPQVRSFVATEI